MSDWQKRDTIRAYVYAAWGEKKLESGDNDLAIKGLNQAIVLYPHAKVYSYRAHAKVNRGQYQEAIQDYNEAISLIPDDAGAYYNRGTAKLNSEDYAGAIQDFDKVLELNPAYTAAYLNRGAAKAAQRDYTGAIQDYTEAIKLKEGLADAYYNRGNAKRKSKNYAKAIDDYTQAINLKENYSKAYLDRGNAKLESEDYVGAIDDYTEAVNLKENYADAYYNRGHTKKTLGQDGDANLDYATAFYYWGKADFNRDHYQAAIQYLDKSIELNPDYATYHARGDAKRAIKDYKGAIDDYTAAINRKPDHAEAYYYLGRTYLDLDKYTKARDYFIEVCTILEETINKKPEVAEYRHNLVETHHYLGVTLHRLGDYKVAIDHFGIAIRLAEPVTYAEAYKTRGDAKKALGEDLDAKVDYTTAYYHWGDEAHKRAEYLEAITNFDSILELDLLAPEFAYDARGNAKGRLGRSKAALGDLGGRTESVSGGD